MIYIKFRNIYNFFFFLQLKWWRPFVSENPKTPLTLKSSPLFSEMQNHTIKVDRTFGLIRNPLAK